MSRWNPRGELSFRWSAEFVVRPTRRPHLGKGPCWTSGAQVRFSCPRCGSSLLVVVDLETMHRDPNDNHLLGTRPDSYTYFAEVREALLPLDSHVCVPGRPVDLGASLHEQYERLSVLFAELSEAASHGERAAGAQILEAVQS
jgi:hypothetical protein